MCSLLNLSSPSKSSKPARSFRILPGSNPSGPGFVDVTINGRTTRLAYSAGIVGTTEDDQPIAVVALRNPEKSDELFHVEIAADGSARCCGSCRRECDWHADLASALFRHIAANG